MFPFQIQWPLDAGRIAPLPGGSRVTLRAADGQEISQQLPDVTEVTPHVLHWPEQGVIAHVLLLPEPAAVRVPATLCGPPGERCGILANRRGSAVQARAAWGSVQSKYDAFLSANLDPDGPGDRRVVLPFLELTLRIGAEETPVSAAHVCSFSAGADCLRWEIRIRSLTFSVTLCLGAGNAITLDLQCDAAASPDCALLIRPWLDDRSFHTVTQAFRGAEHDFPRRIAETAHGFSFALQGGHLLNVDMQGAAWHSAPQWRYCVPLPECAARGLDPQMDVFSPGAFCWELSAHSALRLTAGVDGDVPPQAAPEQAGDASLPAVIGRSLDLFLADRGGELTVIAGFPWFLDWGRDSLIFVRGLIACGRLAEAGSILRRFAAFEEEGTLPNLLRGATVTNRETSDAPLWLVAGIGELIAAGGGTREEFEAVVASIVAAKQRLLMHAETGFVFSAPHHTWMDTDQPPYTPRTGYPIEIQALWHRTLRVAAEQFGIAGANDLAARVAGNLERYFWCPQTGCYADFLHPDLTPDTAVRPNQWLAITLGALTDPQHIRQALETTQCLLVPGAARSLSAADPAWQPRYSGPEDVSRKPAYHNGTAWTWQYPLFSEALFLAYGAPAQPAARQLLSASAVLLNDGCPGQLPEILDGARPHLPRGCPAQAWSVSEWLRVWKLLAP